MARGEQPLALQGTPDIANHRLRYRLRRAHYVGAAARPLEPEAPTESAVSRILAEREQQIAKLTTDKTTLHDLALRARAELENARKRFQREKSETIKFANEHLVREFIVVADNLDRALESAENVTDAKALHDGVKMVLDQFLGILKANGVEVIAPNGQLFDPHFHEAVAREDIEGIEDNTIVGTVQKGYMLRERVVRPAMVRVGRAVRPRTPADDLKAAARLDVEETLADFDDQPCASENAEDQPSNESDSAAN
jgi:molecular chaperone GrpE